MSWPTAWPGQTNVGFTNPVPPPVGPPVAAPPLPAGPPPPPPAADPKAAAAVPMNPYAFGTAYQMTPEQQYYMQWQTYQQQYAQWQAMYGEQVMHIIKSACDFYFFFLQTIFIDVHFLVYIVE